jgi:Tol biopolymer transport system component
VAINEWWKVLTVKSTEAGVTQSFDHLVPEGEMILGGTWSPDGREVWFESWSPLGATSTVQALDVSTGAVHELFPPLPDRAMYFSLSADGHTMAFLRPESDGSVSVLAGPLGDADARVVTKLNVPGQDPVNGLALPAISPRGDQIFYALQRAATTGGHPAPDAGSIWVIDAAGSGAHKVATAPHIVSAAWDPSGRHIAYTAEGVGVDNATVVRVVEVATGRINEIPVEKTNDRIAITDWSRDGRRIGLVRFKNWWEYWAVQGLQEGGR